MYNTEEEFLKNYNPDKYERCSVTSNILLISVSNETTDNYRKLNKKNLSILLVKRHTYPYKDKWCLPGGFIKNNETSEEASKRILAKETNLHNVYMEQLYTFDNVARDPRMRIFGITYMALVDKNKLDDTLYEDCSWFNIHYTETENKYNVTLDNGLELINFIIGKTLKEKTTDRYKFNIIENNNLAFDHPIVIISGIERLKNKIMYTDIVFNMMSSLFTLKELQQVYEVILNKKLLDPAFRRIIADKVIKTDKKKLGEGHRPSYLFRYKSKDE